MKKKKRRTKENLKWEKDSSPILNILVTDSVIKKTDNHLTVKLMLI